MNTVISVSQAKQITGGRTPLIPFEYESAVNALEACINIDEAKYWANKSDALAAWAKMYRDDKVGRQAKILKLKAYRRIGELAKEIRPQTISSNGRRGKFAKGSGSLLKEHGFTQLQRAQITKLANTAKAKFDEVVLLDRPPTPHRFAKTLSHKNPEWRELLSAMYTFRTVIRKTSTDVVESLNDSEIKTARTCIVEIQERLDALEARLRLA